MKKTQFTFESEDHQTITAQKWVADGQPKACIQIAHGMAEHIERYDEFAMNLAQEGYAVYGNDHRGHGKTAGTLENVGYFADQDGFNLVVQDMKQLTDIIREAFPGIPVFLFGHSMGSLLSRNYITKHADSLKGLILSGVMGDLGEMSEPVINMIKGEAQEKGPKAPSAIMADLTGKSRNEAFEPARTDFDWLTRDEKQVDKYIADPFCGSDFSCGYWIDFLTGLQETSEQEKAGKLPQNLPVFFLSGDKDPIGNNGQAVKDVCQTYKNAGVKDVTIKLYPEGRHEMINEPNKSEVFQDIFQWVAGRL